ncbi:hypothetical protein NKH77_09125 [Streptomyces sp. M19]
MGHRPRRPARPGETGRPGSAGRADRDARRRPGGPVLAPGPGGGHRLVPPPLGDEAVRAFPYAPVVGHYRQVGKAAVAPELVALLRGARTRLMCAGPPGYGARPPRTPWRAGRPRRLAAGHLAAADLLRPGHGVRQLRRARAAGGRRRARPGSGDGRGRPGGGPPRGAGRGRVRGAARRPRPPGSGPGPRRCCGRWPGSTSSPRGGGGPGSRAALTGLRDVLAATPGDRPLACAGRDAATALLDRAPGAVRRAADLALLPVTTLHDEYMFIRCIQLFERLFTQVARALLVATDAVRLGRPAAAVRALGAAERRLAHATGPLYRVLTTMPPAAFSVIRGTPTARARSSRSPTGWSNWRARRAGGRPRIGEGPAARPGHHAPGAVRGVRRERRAADAEELAAVMRRLDATWQAMKRTHWGVTLKIIGRVSGTGGTTGAEYLKAAADVPLFPLLAE